eukprot:TRINITY_DN6351_c0_g1_i1.p1 TRINITY_DN6351_c0_g1~~TRINITY_DN6351_c0_g1_i1.p1  ORF type:complete len:120 (+),score=11.21 TRINITY_DN6351_c0_g1_i1:115-474(+)
MTESLNLFEDTINSKWFNSTDIILFLNKMDLFEEKIKTVNLKDFFSDYEGGMNYKDGVEFVRNLYMNKNKSKKQVRTIYSHETCATNTGNIKVVFEAVQAIVLDKALKKTGLDPTGGDF